MSAIKPYKTRASCLDSCQVLRDRSVVVLSRLSGTVFGVPTLFYKQPQDYVFICPLCTGSPRGTTRSLTGVVELCLSITKIGKTAIQGVQCDEVLIKIVRHL